MILCWHLRCAATPKLQRQPVGRQSQLTGAAWLSHQELLLTVTSLSALLHASVHLLETGCRLMPPVLHTVDAFGSSMCVHHHGSELHRLRVRTDWSMGRQWWQGGGYWSAIAGGLMCYHCAASIELLWRLRAVLCCAGCSVTCLLRAAARGCLLLVSCCGAAML